jgi:tRNA1(Val) A37 N6-methylase TrmN6
MNAPEAALTEDAYLGGRLTLCQPARGLRAGADALFLAAAVPAKPGERVLEAGVGTGAASLALIARVGGIAVVGIEIEPAHAALAHENTRANRLAGTLEVVEGDIAAMTPAALAASGHAPPFDHAMANPPYFEPAAAQAPADPARCRARIAGSEGLDIWVARLADALAGDGTCTMIHRAETLGRVLAAMQRRLGAVTVLPLAPKLGAAASRVIVQARKGARAPLRLLPPLVLHRPDGRYTSAAERVLREARAIALDGAEEQPEP